MAFCSRYQLVGSHQARDSSWGALQYPYSVSSVITSVITRLMVVYVTCPLFLLTDRLLIRPDHYNASVRKRE